MRRLISHGLTAVSLASTLIAAQQGPQFGNAAIPTLDTVRKIGDRLIFRRLPLPRDAWPALPNPRMDASNSESPDAATLAAAGSAGDYNLRREYLKVIGRLAMPADLALFVYPGLGDGVAEVRAEAANAIAQIVHDVTAAGGKVDVSDAIAALEDRIRRETDGSTAATMLEVLGEIADEGTARLVEPFLVAETFLKFPPTSVSRGHLSGALSGLEAMTRHLPGYGFSAATRTQLRRLATPGLAFAGETGPYLRAVQALVHIREGDVPTIRAIATYRCPGSGPECGWEIRRLGLQLMTQPRREFLDAIRRATSDPALLVRIEAYRVYAREIPTTKICSPLFDAWSDPEPWVVLEAIKLLDTRCESEKAVIVDRLKEWANDLGDSMKDDRWQLPAGAFEALAKFDADTARKVAHEMAKTHRVWFVRAAAARVAAIAGDEPLAVELADDKEPNVRAEAINTLYRMKSAKLGPAAIAALDSSNYQLVYTAAASLATSPDRESASKPILDSLRRLTEIGDDTSREARVALLARIQQAAVTDDEAEGALSRLLQDSDPPVAQAASDVLQALTGVRRPPTPLYTEPQKELPRDACVDVVMQNGEQFSILLNPQLAPYSADHFLNLVAHAFYNGSSFHRAIPDAFLEAGSPAANFFTGADDRHLSGVGPQRFFRDEITYDRDPGWRHQRGIVAMSRHDPHTVATQFFIELVDSPHFNRDFTIIGRVTDCARQRISDPMDTVDKLMQGATIASMRIHHGAPVPLP